MLDSERALSDRRTGRGPVLVFIVDHRTPDRIYMDGMPVPLPFLQFRLASLFGRHPGQCIPYETIYRELWGNQIVEDNQIHFQLSRLRKAITKLAPHRASLIRTIHKIGVMLDLSPDEVLVIPNQLAHTGEGAP